MNDCLFCKIIRQEIPSKKVYEDERVYAFLDIHPVNPGHTLVVPKQHCSGILDCDTEVAKNWIGGIQKVAQAIKDGLGLEGFNLMQNQGTVAGQVIPHLHMHIIPRHAGDGLNLWHGKDYSSSEEAELIASKIKVCLTQEKY